MCSRCHSWPPSFWRSTSGASARTAASPVRCSRARLAWRHHMAEEIQPDKETYDRLIAAGESERTARAKAKAAAARKARGPNPASLSQAAAPAAAPAEGAAPAAAPAAAAPPAAAPAAARPAAPARTAPGNGGRLTPEERAARVAA